jgi:hypothetical protein
MSLKSNIPLLFSGSSMISYFINFSIYCDNTVSGRTLYDKVSLAERLVINLNMNDCGYALAYSFEK